MSSLLKALIICQPCACSLRKHWFLDFNDVSPATKSFELVKFMHAYLLMEATFVYAPSILKVWNQLGVISNTSHSSTSEGETNLDPILKVGKVLSFEYLSNTIAIKCFMSAYESAMVALHFARAAASHLLDSF